MSSDARLEQLQRDLARLRAPAKPAKGRDGGRGREADHPGEIPPRGWKDILWRAWGEVSEQNLFLIAGGVTYAVLVALFPGLAMSPPFPDRDTWEWLPCAVPGSWRLFRCPDRRDRQATFQGWRLWP